MERLIVRQYSKEEIPRLTELWVAAFGDDRALIGRFFELLPEMGTAYIAEYGGRIVGMASVLAAVIDGLRCGYVYAVATDEKYRGKGIGTAMMRYCRERFPRLCTLPASAELYEWYEKCLGTDKISRCRYEELAAAEGDFEIKSLSSAEYAAMRGEFRLGTAFPLAWYEYERELCRTYGGGMFRCGRSIACGYLDGGVLYVKECLGSDEYIPELCRRLGAEKAIVRYPFHAGERFIAANFALPEKLNMPIALD